MLAPGASTNLQLYQLINLSNIISIKYIHKYFMYFVFLEKGSDQGGYKIDGEDT